MVIIHLTDSPSDTGTPSHSFPSVRVADTHPPYVKLNSQRARLVIAALFVARGASSNPEQVIDGFWMGLSKRSIQVD
ncbi:hypothetical protein GCM10027068_21980 [Prescottella soli]